MIRHQRAPVVLMSKPSLSPEQFLELESFKTSMGCRYNSKVKKQGRPSKRKLSEKWLNE